MTAINLDSPGALKLLSKEVLSDIDTAVNELYTEGPRRHLGASLIGDACSRRLWYKFRWAGFEAFDARQQRLFNRGHREEERFEEWLKKAGFKVQTRDPETGNQWRIEGANGHFGGSLDGIAWLPARYQIDIPFLLEFKTNGTGAGFNKLRQAGVLIGKPVHFDQQCVYGYRKGLAYSIYLNINKNDDDIHCEVIKLNLERGADLEKKATFIIESQVAPNRIAEQKTHPECSYCPFKGPCHDNIPIARNCRSCVNAEPIENKQWRCNHFGSVIPDDFIIRGCSDWKPIA